MELKTAAAVYFRMCPSFRELFVHWLPSIVSFSVFKNSLNVAYIDPINCLEVHLIYLDHLLILTPPPPHPHKTDNFTLQTQSQREREKHRERERERRERERERERGGVETTGIKRKL